MPDPRRSALTPKYRWNQAAGQYIRTDGTFVSREQVNNALEYQIAKSRGNMRTLSEQLQSGEIDLQEWRTGMLREIKTAHVASAAGARGGWAQMSPADYGKIGPRLKFQYERLNIFASEIQYGKQPLDGQMLRRAEMYGEAARGTAQNTALEERAEAGNTEGRRVLGVADHCRNSKYASGCIELAARGWVPIAELVPIGDATCMTACKCRYLTR
jgi:hypothetical protein